MATKKAAKSGTKSASGTKASSKKGASKGSGKRELIDTGKNKMYAKRGAGGEFTEMDDVSRSLSADAKQTAKTKVKPGYGDQGDRASTKAGAKGGAKKGGSKKAATKK